MSVLLQLDEVARAFRGLRAVDGISLSIEAGEIVGLIGPNGAGKTTLVNVVTGVHPATEGVVRFAGEDITRLRPNRIARRGVGRTFQIVQPFPHMTVGENIAAGALFAGGARSLAEAAVRARELAESVGLGDVVERPAETLTLARRKRLELAKGLAMRPKLLFLDEVNAGLNGSEIDDALALIRAIAAGGVTIVVIEHLMKVVLSISTRIVVLHHGQLIADGTPQQVVRDRAVNAAYLGKRYAAALAKPRHERARLLGLVRAAGGLWRRAGAVGHRPRCGRGRDRLRGRLERRRQEHHAAHDLRAAADARRKHRHRRVRFHPGSAGGDPACRRRPCARGPPPIRGHERRGQSAHGRLPAPR